MNFKDTIFCKKTTLNLKGKLIDVKNPIVMGILNVTPDSFYKESRHNQQALILKRATEILQQGGTIIDIGGYSSRPNAQHITEEEELNRVIPAIKIILAQFPEAFISIDTFRSSIARAAIGVGACMINDISGGDLDKEMFKVVSEMQVPYVLMHMRGTPQTMNLQTNYKNIFIEVIEEIQNKVQILQQLYIKDVIIDLGFGFAKNIEQNFELLQKLIHCNIFNYPILVGISRKSMIYKTLDTTPEDMLTLIGTTCLNTLALNKGANILRVHDVKEAVASIKLFNLTNN